MSVELRAVESPERDRAFLRVPWLVFRDDPRWVPPLLHSVKRRLSTKKNPFWRDAERATWVAERDGVAIGRVMAIVNRAHDERWNERAGFVGFFDAIDDEAVVHRLLDTARDWLVERGATVIRGPASPDLNDECGLLVEGNDRDPFIMMPYNPLYYPRYFESWGFTKAMDLYAFSFSAQATFPPKVERVAAGVQKRLGVTMRPVDLTNFDDELEKLRYVYNEAWADNWGFVPMSKEAFAFASAEFKPVILPDFVQLAEIDGKVVGAAIAAPNLNPLLKKANGRLLPFGFRHLLGWRKKKTNMRLLTMGVVPQYHGKGIDALFYRAMLAAGKKEGLSELSELGWVLESNDVMTATIERIGGARTKTLRLYERPA